MYSVCRAVIHKSTDAIIVQCIYAFIITIDGSDYTTLTGNECIRAVFLKGSNTSTMKIRILQDLMDEDEEYFTAELQSESNDTNTSVMATITIRDTAIILCSFDRSEYSVYESVGHVLLTLNSSKATPHSNYTVLVDTVYGNGNASGEYIVIWMSLNAYMIVCHGSTVWYRFAH